MPVKILRWKGGSGGDFLLSTRPGLANESLGNVKHTKILDNGRAGVDMRDVNYASLREIDKIALLDPYIHQVNQQKLLAEIQDLEQQNNLIWLKSHYFELPVLNAITVDLQITAESLPFVLKAHMEKAKRSFLPFNQIEEKIKDTQIKNLYYLYCIAYDFIHTKRSFSDNLIPVSAMWQGWDTLKYHLDRYEIKTNDQTQNIYSQWINKNLDNIPSNNYLDMLKNKDFDYNKNNLSLYEKYSLLVLVDKRFKLLSHSATEPILNCLP